VSTSGVSDFDLDLSELIEEAFERAGSELRTGYDMRTARRSMNILFADWANRGINMWTIEQGSFTLTQGLNTYALPLDTVDLLEHVIRTNANSTSNQADLTITRISISTYATLPNKLQQARPIQVLIQRNSGQVSDTVLTLNGTITATATSITLSSVIGLAAAGYIKLEDEVIYYGYIVGNVLTACSRGQANTNAVPHSTGLAVYVSNPPAISVWPTPDGSQTYTFVYWRLKRNQNAGTGVNTMSVPFRFIPCIAAGLAYYLAMKLPNGMERLPILKTQYDEAWQFAQDEDREKAAVRFVPRQMFIGGGM
jgi:hypothetical protein